MSTESEQLATQIETHAGAHWLARDAAGMIRKQAAELKRLQDYDTKLSAVMHADYKDWHEGSKKEWPELAAESIKMWRYRANEAYAEIERANALLRHAYAAIEEAVELIGSDECTAKETLAAIKQHLGEV